MEAAEGSGWGEGTCRMRVSRRGWRERRAGAILGAFERQ